MHGHDQEFSLREAIVETVSRSLNTAASFTATAGLALPAIFSALLDDETEASASAIIALVMGLMISCVIAPIPGRLGVELNIAYEKRRTAETDAAMAEMRQKIQENYQYKILAELLVAGFSMLFLVSLMEPILPVFGQSEAVNAKIVTFGKYWAIAPTGLAVRMIPEQGLFASPETKHLPKFLALPWFLLFGVGLSAFLCFQQGWGLPGLAVGLSVEFVASAVSFWAAFLLKQPEYFPREAWLTVKNAWGVLATFREAFPYFIQALSQTAQPLALEGVARHLNKDAFLARGILNRPGAIIAFPVVAMRQAVNQLLGPAKSKNDYAKMREYVKAALILTIIASGVISLGAILYFSGSKHVPGTNPRAVKMIKEMMVPNGLEAITASFGQILTAGCRTLGEHVFPAVVTPVCAWIGLLVGIGLGVSQMGIPGFAVALALGQVVSAVLLWSRWDKKCNPETQQLFSWQGPGTERGDMTSFLLSNHNMDARSFSSSASASTQEDPEKQGTPVGSPTQMFEEGGRYTPPQPSMPFESELLRRSPNVELEASQHSPQ